MDTLPQNLRFNFDHLTWFRQTDNSDPEHPVDTWTAVLGGDATTGRIDFLVKWEPNAYCPFHRHLGDTVSIVLEGQHYVEDADDPTAKPRIRPAGHYALTPAADYHMERRGPEGSLVFFSLQAKDGKMFEILDGQKNVIAVTALDEMLALAPPPTG